MKRPKNGYTMRQHAYAMRKLAPKDSTSKKAMALAVGYSPGVATSVMKHIESTEGYANAMAALASETGNNVLRALAVLKNRDLEKESTGMLLEVIDTLARNWERFTPQQVKDDKPARANALRAIILEDVRIIDAETRDAPAIETESMSDGEREAIEEADI